MTLRNEVGLHARPAARFVEAAAEFDADITVRNVTRDGEAQNAKSILSVLAVGGEQGHDIEITADGSDADRAVERLRRLVESDFVGEPSDVDA